MNARLQAGPNGRLPPPPEVRFPIRPGAGFLVSGLVWLAVAAGAQEATNKPPSEANAEQTQAIASILQNLGYRNTVTESDRDDPLLYTSLVYGRSGDDDLLTQFDPAYRGKRGLRFGVHLERSARDAEDKRANNALKPPMDKRLRLPICNNGALAYIWTESKTLGTPAAPYGLCKLRAEFVCGNLFVDLYYGGVSVAATANEVKAGIDAHEKTCIEEFKAIIIRLAEALCGKKHYRVEGRVLGIFDQPLHEAKVYLTDQNGRELTHYVTSTDRQGFYAIDMPQRKLDERFDPETDRIRVRAQLTIRRGDRDYVDVAYSRSIQPRWYTGIRSDQLAIPVEATTFTRDFRFMELADGYLPLVNVPQNVLPDLAAIYHHLHEAFLLTDVLRLPLDYGSPLPVLTYAAPTNTAFWAGSFTGSRTVPQPFIVFGIPTSDYFCPDRPDNREWHEFAHHLTAEAFLNAMPHHPQTVNHNGYYLNARSTDAFTEGMAEFLSMMIAKHVVHDPYAHCYELMNHGFYVDMELDYRAWRPFNLGEEMAVAGLLLDLEDGPEDYAQPANPPDLQVVQSGLVEAEGQRAIVGRVRNRSAADAVSVAVYVGLYDAAGALVYQGASMTHPRDLRGTAPARLRDPPRRGQVGTFGIPLVDVPAFDRYEVAVREIISDRTGTDDDPVNLTLAEVWDTLTKHRSTERRFGNGFTFDVKDLYDAFSGRFGGKDANRNNVDDIKELFINHGFFADGNGDRVWQPEEEVGMSDHPGSAGLATMVPRRNMPPEPGAFIAFDVGGAAAATPVTRFLVDRRLPAAQGRGNRCEVVDLSAGGGPAGRLPLLAPPEAYGVTTYVVPLDAQDRPGKPLVVKSGDFWKAMDGRPGEKGFMTHTFEMPPPVDPASVKADPEEALDAAAFSLPRGVVPAGTGTTAAVEGQPFDPDTPSTRRPGTNAPPASGSDVEQRKDVSTGAVARVVTPRPAPDATHPPAPAAAAGPVLRLKAKSVHPGERIIVTLGGLPPKGLGKFAWIGFYKEAAGNKEYIRYNFVADLDNDTYEDILAPDEPGRYNFRIFADEGYEPLAVSESVDVVKP